MTTELPAERGIFPPDGGWKELTHYVVDIAWRSTNPIHRGILYVGFLNGRPELPLSGGYTGMMYSDSESLFEFGNPERAYYLRPVCEIPEMKG